MGVRHERPSEPRASARGSARRSGAVAAALAVLLVACSGGDRPALTSETLPLATDGGTTAEDLGSGVEAGDGEVQLGEAITVSRDDIGALVTPNGIVVPVAGVTDDGYEITTPCGNEGFLALGTPILGADVVLDPGHGGQVETGAVGPNGLAEKDLNLDLAEATRTELERRGFRVVLTRTADYRVPLRVRAEIGNRLEAGAMVSIHHNAPNWLPSDTPGTEVFVQSGSDESRRLGGLIQEAVVAALSTFEGITWTTADDAGAIVVLNADGDDAYGMIRRPEIPAVLAEFGYLSNPSEAELFATDAYLVAASIALADAVESFLLTDAPGSGFVAEPRIFTPSGATGGVDGCVDPDLGA